MHFGGTDFFEAEDAADYCGVTMQQWKKDIAPRIRPGQYRGRTIYRREDLKRYVERQTTWPRRGPNYALIDEWDRPRKRTAGGRFAPHSSTVNPGKSKSKDKS